MLSRDILSFSGLIIPLRSLKRYEEKLDSTVSVDSSDFSVVLSQNINFRDLNFSITSSVTIAIFERALILSFSNSINLTLFI